MKDKDWFPSKKLIDETALKMKEAHDKGFEAEYRNKQKALRALLFSDVAQKDGLFYKDKIAYDVFIKLISENIIDKWTNNTDQKEPSFVGYLAVSISFKAKTAKKLVRNGYDSDIAVNRKKDENKKLVPETVKIGDDEFNILENESGPEIEYNFDRLVDLREALDKIKCVIDKTRQKNSKVCNRTFSSEHIMLYYIPYSDGRLLKQVSNQFEAVTYYSLFGFLMESDIIDPATVNSIDDIFKCHVPGKYYTKEGKEIKMIPHNVTCEYLKKFHEIEKTASQLSDIYRSYMKAMNKPNTTTE